MSTDIEHRVVRLTFDNAQFEAGTKKTMGTLEKLQKALKFDKVTDAFGKITKGANKVDMSHVATSTDIITTKFNAMAVVATTALMNITNGAINAGKNIVNAFTLQPVTTGLSEYETKMGAIQTILSNTSLKGNTLEEVNAGLEELNRYADKTIYNFTEMTKNIGTFTAAGVDLDLSIQAIKGIANLGAISGSTAPQVSSAMYQISQALAAGKVSLMDWNSIVNAGMGGEVFQNELMRTARNFGVDVDGMIAKYGTFRESLTEGAWLTTDVLTATLEKFTGDLSKEQLMAQGYTEQHADEIIKLGQMANAAATEVKTFTGLMDTLKETAQSGWTTTWEILIGNFEESKALFTNLYNTLGGVINKFSDARNNLLLGWKQLGGRNVVIDTLASSFTNLGKLLVTIGSAFREVFPAMTAERLYDLTLKFQDFMKKLEISDKMMSNIKTTFKGFFSIIKNVGEVLTIPLKFIPTLIDGFTGFADIILEIGATLAESASKIMDFIVNAEAISVVTDAILKVLNLLIGKFKEFARVFDITYIAKQFDRIGPILDAVGAKFEKLKNFVKGVAAEFKDLLSDMFAKQTTKNMDKTLEGLGKIFSGAFKGIGDVISVSLGGMKDLISSIGVDELVDALVKLATVKHIGSIAKSFGLIGDSFKSFSKAIGGALESITGIGGAITETLDGVRETLGRYQNSISPGKIALIAGSVAILALSLRVLSTIDKGKLLPAIGALGALMVMLGALSAFLVKFGKLKVGASMVVLAYSIKILAESVAVLADIPTDKIQNGLGSLLGVMAMLLAYGVASSRWSKDMPKTSAAMIVMAAAVYVLAEAMDSMSKLSWERIGKGLTVVTGLMASLTIFSNVLSKKATIQAGVSLLAIATAVKLLTTSMDDMSKLSWEKIGKGLSAIGGLLLELGIFTKIVDNSKLLSTAVSLTIVSGAIILLSNVMTDMSKLSWDKIGKGLTAIGGLLLELGIYTRLLDTKRITESSVGIVILTGALWILTEAIDKMSKLSWNGIGKGLATVGGLLLGLAVYTRLLDGKGLMTSSAAMIILTGAIMGLCEVVKGMSTLSWTEIGRGLSVLAGTMAILAAAIFAMPSNLPVIATGLVVVSGAMLIMAEAMRQMGGLSIDQLLTSLIVLGGALIELSIALHMMDKCLAGAAALAIVSVGLVALASAMTSLSKLDLAGAAIALGVLAGTLTIFGAAAYLLGPLVGVITGLAGGIALFSLSIAGLGAALVLVAAGLGGIGVALMASGNEIVKFLKKLLEAAITVLDKFAKLIPKVVKYLGEAIIELVKVLGDGSAVLVEALVKIISALLEGLDKLVPQIVEVVINILDKVLESIANHIEPMVANLVKIIVGVIRGLNVHLPELINAAMDLIINLLTGIFDAVGRLDFETINKAIVGGALLAVFVGTISLIAPLIPGAMIALAELGVLVAELIAIIGVIGMIGAIPGVDWLLGKGGDLLGLIGKAIGKFVGGIIGGGIEGITSSFPEVGKNLAAFMENAKPFFEGAATINESAVNGVKNIAAAVALMTGTSIVDSIVSFFTDNSPLVEFGKTLAEFAPYFKSFADSISDVKADVVEKSANAMLAIGKFAALVPNQGGLAALFAGENSLVMFAEELTKFGPALAKYSKSVEGVDADVVEKSANAAKAICEFAAIVPNKGGLVALFTGDNNLSAFAEELVPFGKAISKYSSTVENVSETSVQKSANAAKMIVEFMDIIPNTGGMVSWFTGDNSLSAMAEELAKFGPALVTYSNEVSNVKMESVTNSVDAAKKLVDFMLVIPEKIPSAYTFTDGLRSISKGVEKYYDNISEVDMASLIASTSVVEELVSMLRNMDGLTSSYAVEFNNAMSEISTVGVNSFILSFTTGKDSVRNVVTEFINEAVNAIKDKKMPFENAGRDLVSSLSNGIKNNSKYICDSIYNAIDEALNKLSGYSPRFSSFGSELATMIADGANKQNSSVRTTFESIIKNALDAAKDSGKKFKDSGKTLIDKLAEGMNDKAKKSSDAMTSICNSLVNGLQQSGTNFRNAGTYLMNSFNAGITQGANSSTYQHCRNIGNGAANAFNSGYNTAYSNGRYLVQGFANGISANKHLAVNAAINVANSANRAFRNVLQIKSPSRVMMENGKFFDQGFAKGILNNITTVQDASKSLANNARDAFRKAISNIPLIMDDEFNYSPVITPVIDLDSAIKQQGVIDSMFNNRGAVQVSAVMRNRQNGFVESVDNPTNTATVENLLARAINLLQDIKAKDSNVYMDGRQVSKAITGKIDNELAFNQRKRW